CGITITDFYSPLTAHNLPGVTGYKFRVSNLSNPSGVNAVQELTRTANWFSFIDLMSFEFGAEYSIEVSVRINDQYSAFGNPCSVYTVSPGIKQCGTTFSDKYVPVYAHSYPGVSGYRFRVTNQSTASVQVITRNVNWINFNNIDDFQVATAYDVEVAYLTNGAYTDYGSVCTIYSVSPSIKQCGDTISDYYAPMIAQSIPGATGYRFRVTNLTTESVQVIIPSSNWINFNHIIDRQSGTAYSIEVSVLMNGVYSGYGAACTVYTAGAAKISGEQELVELKLNVTASPSPFTDAFNLNLSNATGASVTINIYDMIGKLLEVRTVRPGDIASQSLGSWLPSGVYNVVVTQ
ncbi:MAG: T9SS type A sorting domain-containing protein, partial [Proteiniphilum sp.]|nr:T9SS type A sorting domain-containing protein [Proteiniphilum sp.]